jgi:hypothetical protein
LTIAPRWTRWNFAGSSRCSSWSSVKFTQWRSFAVAAKTSLSSAPNHRISSARRMSWRAPVRTVKRSSAGAPAVRVARNLLEQRSQARRHVLGPRQVLARARERLGQALGAKGFQQVVDGVGLERAHRVVVERGREDHQRPRLGQRLEQREAVESCMRMSRRRTSGLPSATAGPALGHRPASPTISVPPRSSSRRRTRARASGSSSTMRMRSGLAWAAIYHYQASETPATSSVRPKYESSALRTV